MGFFENMHIESELKEQRDLFNSQIEDEVEQFLQKTRPIQETEAKFHEWEMRFRKWFIENYLIPKYFTNKKGHA